MPKKKVELFKSLMVGVILRYDTVGRYSEEGVNDFLDELEDYLNHAVQEGHIFASLFLEGDDRPIEALGSSIDGFNMKQSRLLDVAVVFFFELPHLCTKTACEDLAAVVASLVEDFCVVKVASANIPPAGRADFQKAVLGTAEGRTESFKRDIARTGALPNPPKRNGGRYQAPRRATRYDRGYTEWTLEDDARARAAQKKPGALPNPPRRHRTTREVRNADYEKGAQWYKKLSRTDKWELGDQLVLGSFDWHDWGFASKPSSAFMNGAERERMLWEQIDA